MSMKEGNNPSVLLVLLLVTVVLTIGLATFMGNQNGPKKWAEQAPLERVVVGGANPYSVKLSKRIAERDRQGMGLDQLQEIVQSRPDNPSGDLVPIPYGQWLQERTDAPWSKYLRN